MMGTESDAKYEATMYVSSDKKQVTFDHMSMSTAYDWSESATHM